MQCDGPDFNSLAMQPGLIIQSLKSLVFSFVEWQQQQCGSHTTVVKIWRDDTYNSAHGAWRLVVSLNMRLVVLVGQPLR